MYNVKIIHYPNGRQVNIYNQMVGYKSAIKSDPAMVAPYFDVNGDIDVNVSEGTSIPDFNILQDDNGLHVVSSPANKLRSQSVSLNRTKNMVYYLARSNIWDWFITLTFDPNLVDSFNYDEVAKHLSFFFNNLRKKYPDCKYLFVPEKHDSGRFHFHGLLSGVPDSAFIYSGHNDKKGTMIFNFAIYRKGFSTATRIVDNKKVTRYICKYITKDSLAVSEGKKRYWSSRNCNRAESETLTLTSLDYFSFLKKCLGDASYISYCENDGLGVYYCQLDN